MRELWEVEWKEKSRDGIEIIGGLIKENTLEELKETMKNEDLIQLLEIKKSLVYFSASLKSISSMLSKMSRGRHIN